MIAKMNKLTLLVYHKEYTAFLQRLRDIGVVHIVEKNSGAVEDPELEKQLAVAAKYARTIKRFEALSKDGFAPAGDVSEAAASVERLTLLCRTPSVAMWSFRSLTRILRPLSHGVSSGIAE